MMHEKLTRMESTLTYTSTEVASAGETVLLTGSRGIAERLENVRVRAVRFHCHLRTRHFAFV